MSYQVTKIEGQNLGFLIKTIFNNEEIAFNVFCAESEDEIEDLVNFHLNSLANPPVIDYSQIPNMESQQSQIDALTARIEALEAAP